jgi:hypothetical protein
MLMQPQSPNPDFDFMLKDQPQSGRNLPLTNLPRPVIYGVGGLLIVILLIVGLSLLSGRQGSSQPLVGVLARNQEILRVTTVAQPQLNDSQVKALAATATASLNSDKQQITAYLASRHIKPKPAQLAVDIDTSTDAAFRSAGQNNGMDQAYVSYLRDALNKYETELRTASQSTSVKVKSILNDATVSIISLLASPPLKS